MRSKTISFNKYWTVYLMVPMITLFIFSLFSKKKKKPQKASYVIFNVCVYVWMCVCVYEEKIHIKLAVGSRLLKGERWLLLSEARWKWGDNSPWRLGKENCHFLTIFEWANQTRFQKEQILLQPCHPSDKNAYPLSDSSCTLFSTKDNYQNMFCCFIV